MHNTILVHSKFIGVLQLKSIFKYTTKDIILDQVNENKTKINEDIDFQQWCRLNTCTRKSLENEWHNVTSGTGKCGFENRTSVRIADIFLLSGMDLYRERWLVFSSQSDVSRPISALFRWRINVINKGLRGRTFIVHLSGCQFFLVIPPRMFNYVISIGLIACWNLKKCIAFQILSLLRLCQMGDNREISNVECSFSIFDNLF
jgi:hypothetical protein